MPTEIKAQNTTTLASVKAIYDAADQANTLLDGMQAAATAAGTTLDGIYQDAADAQTAADDAQASADNASEYAARALGNLSTVQNITETLNWITAHGTMTLTSDVALDPTHVYFVVDAGGDYVVGGTHYSVVTEPDVADISTYYELSINESLNNYVATHVAVDSEGLWLIPDAGLWKVLIATGGAGHTYTDAGMYIIFRDGGVDKIHAKFTSDGNIMKGGLTLGNQTSAGLNGLAAGTYTTAVASSYALGYGANANGPSSLVIGRNNIPDTETPDAYGYRKYPFIIGNGDKSTYLGTKSNALTVDWSGNLEAAGDITDGSGNVLSDKLQEDSNGDLTITRSITAGYEITDGYGNVLSNIADHAVFEDANGDAAITRNITAGGDIEAAGNVTDGSGNVLANKANKYSGYGTSVDISTRTSSNKYTIPSDGVVTVMCTYRSASYIQLFVDDNVMAQPSSPSNANAAGNIVVSVPVFKGQEVYVSRSSTYSTATFRPFTT